MAAKITKDDINLAPYAVDKIIFEKGDLTVRMSVRLPEEKFEYVVLKGYDDEQRRVYCKTLDEVVAAVNAMLIMDEQVKYWHDKALSQN